MICPKLAGFCHRHSRRILPDTNWYDFLIVCDARCDGSRATTTSQSFSSGLDGHSGAIPVVGQVLDPFAQANHSSQKAL